MMKPWTGRETYSDYCKGLVREYLSKQKSDVTCWRDTEDNQSFRVYDWTYRKLRAKGSFVQIAESLGLVPSETLSQG